MGDFGFTQTLIPLDPSRQASIMSEDSERICTFNSVGRSQIGKASPSG